MLRHTGSRAHQSSRLVTLHDFRFFVVVSTSKTSCIFVLKHSRVGLSCPRSMVIRHRMRAWHPSVFFIRELQHQVGSLDSLIPRLLSAIVLLLHLVAATLVRGYAAKVRRLIQLLP